MKKPIILGFVITSLLWGTAPGEWKEWRGPGGQGHASAELPVQWSETENIAWRTPIPGKGWSSPVIEGDQVWMTAAHEKPASPEEEAERLKQNTGSQPLNVLSEVRLHAVCVDKNTGQLLHDIEVLRQKDPQWTHKLNSYASPTPVIENGKLYCHFGSYGSACLDTSNGQVLWRNQDLVVQHENGPGSSPVLWQDKFIFHMDGSDEQYIVALDKATGKVAWRTPRSGEMNPNPQLKKAYGTPLILETAGQPVLYSPAADWLYAYDMTTGKERWKLNYGKLGFSIVPRPIAGKGLLFMSTSFMRPEFLAIRYETEQPEIAWRYDSSVPSQPSPILVADEVYFISDSGGVLTCLDAESGKEHWKERLGGNYSASPLHANGKIYFHSREGLTTVIQAGKTFNLVAKNLLNGSIMASAAVDGSALILRTDEALYRIE